MNHVSYTVTFTELTLTWKLTGGGGFLGSILTTLDSTLGGGRKLFFPTWAREKWELRMKQEWNIAEKHNSPHAQWQFHGWVNRSVPKCKWHPILYYIVHYFWPEPIWDASKRSHWPSWGGLLEPAAECWWIACSTACLQAWQPDAWQTLSGTSALHIWQDTKSNGFIRCLSCCTVYEESLRVCMSLYCVHYTVSCAYDKYTLIWPNPNLRSMHITQMSLNISHW